MIYLYESKRVFEGGFEDMMESSIVEKFRKVIVGLGKFSVLELIRRLVRNNKRYLAKTTSHGFVDLWVVGSLLLAIVGVLWVAFFDNKIVPYFVICIGFFRSFVVVIHQVKNVFVRTDPGLHSHKRTVVLLFVNYLEIIFWFAAIYLGFMIPRILWFKGIQSHVEFEKMILGVYSSFSVMTTFGNSVISAANFCGHVVMFIQSVVGFSLSVIGLAYFVSLLPAPKELETGNEAKKKGKEE